MIVRGADNFRETMENSCVKHRRIVAFCLLHPAARLPPSPPPRFTVSQLNTLLSDMHQRHKSDESVATKLKDIELTEQLTTTAMNSLMHTSPAN